MSTETLLARARQTLAAVCVTGTNGKTTTTSMIEAIVAASGEPSARVTTLGPDLAQVDYRLQESVGCGAVADADGQVAYRLESDRPLEWVGDGLREVGIEPGTTLDADGKDAARLLARGRHPGTNERLVTPKKAVDPRAKLDAAPLVAAVRLAAEAAGKTPAGLLAQPRVVALYGRLQRGVAGAEARANGAKAVPHRAPVGDLEKVAAAANIDLADVYPAADLALARTHTNARVMVGNRGYDLTVDVPKSFSTLVAMADPRLSAELENVYLDCVRETVTAMQQWAGYGMRGHHGDGERAERVAGTGLLGWMTTHRTARPVDGQAPDPHLHAHVTIVNMVRGTDGRWSTLGAGGRDVHRHVKAAGTFMQARLRQITHERWGLVWTRDAGTGATPTYWLCSRKMVTRARPASVMRYRNEAGPIIAPPVTSSWCCDLSACTAGSIALNRRPRRFASSEPVSSPAKCMCLSVSCRIRSSA